MAQGLSRLSLSAIRSRADRIRATGRFAPRPYSGLVTDGRITADPRRMRGLPCIRDTRVTVSAVLGQLATGIASMSYWRAIRIWSARTFSLRCAVPQPVSLRRP